jgi:hypothetical protein
MNETPKVFFFFFFSGLRQGLGALKHGTPNGLFPSVHIHNSVFVAAESLQVNQTLYTAVGSDHTATPDLCRGSWERTRSVPQVISGELLPVS